MSGSDKMVNAIQSAVVGPYWVQSFINLVCILWYIFADLQNCMSIPWNLLRIIGGQALLGKVKSFVSLM